MAKNTYRIPASMDRSYLDHEIPLSAGGWQAPPLAMKVIMFWAGSIMAMLWLVTSTPLKTAGFAIAPIVIWWLIATAIMGKNSKTKEMAFQSVGPTLSYIQRANRRVVTRSTSDPSSFYSVAPFDSIDEDGLITFSDRTFGQAYLVVGSASVLVFEEDKTAILNRVDQFWRKADPDSEWTWTTTKEPQRVHRQVAALGRISKNLRSQDPELRELMEERLDVLQDFVGKKFFSIHQYLVIKSDNLEALRTADGMLDSEIGQSSLMVRQCTRLDRDDTYALLRSVYANEVGQAA